MKSVADWLANASDAQIATFLDDLPDRVLCSVPWLFELWALHGHQLPPGGDWRSWVILGGRGAGKTRAGSEWIRSQVEGSRPLDPGRARRVALIGETLDQAREVMVFGESGILNCTPPDRRPEWQSVRRRLIWPNGASAQIFSASDPESLRGPQFDCAWLDELAKWRKGQEAWDMLQFALRLGPDPRQVVTTTPRASGLLLDILAQDSTVKTAAPTSANRANLAPGFLADMERRYGDTWLGRQELGGELVLDLPGALWARAGLEAARVAAAPALDRVVVAVDPPVTSHATSDRCGIVVAGATLGGQAADWRGYVLEDATVERHSPVQWAQAAAAAYHRWGASCLVVEVNQGGDLVETVLRQVDPSVHIRPVRAARGKSARAEPVAALYEQGRVFHAGGFGALEDEMCAMSVSGYSGLGSPDRLDALVWALTELMIAPAGNAARPRVRGI